MKNIVFLLIAVIPALLACNQPQNTDPRSRFKAIDEYQLTHLKHQIMDSLTAELYSMEMYQNKRHLFSCLPQLTKPYYRIFNKSKGDELTMDGKTCEDIQEEIMLFYTINRNVQIQDQYSIKDDSIRSKYPLFELFTLNYISDKIDFYKSQINELQSLEATDPGVIAYFEHSLLNFKKLKAIAKELDEDTLKLPNRRAFISIDYQLYNDGKELLMATLESYYALRNNASYHYFNESYSSLFYRYLENGSESTQLKLDALSALYPIVVVDVPYCKAYQIPYYHKPEDIPKPVSIY